MFPPSCFSPNFFVLNTDHFDGTIHRFDGIIGRADGIIRQFRWNYSPDLMKLFIRIDEIIGNIFRIIEHFGWIIDHIDEIIDRLDGIIDHFMQCC